MKLDAGKTCPQFGPFGLRFLHAIFAKEPVAGLQDRNNLRSAMALADGHKTGLPRRQNRPGARFFDLRKHGLEIFRRITGYGV